MPIRVLLSNYRASTPCLACGGARLKAGSLWWRVGTHEQAQQALAGRKRLRPVASTLSEQRFDQLPGLNIHDVMGLPLARCQQFFSALANCASSALDDTATLLLREIGTRLDYLCEVGLD